MRQQLKNLSHYRKHLSSKWLYFWEENLHRRTVDRWFPSQLGQFSGNRFCHDVIINSDVILNQVYSVVIIKMWIISFNRIHLESRLQYVGHHVQDWLVTCVVDRISIIETLAWLMEQSMRYCEFNCNKLGKRIQYVTMHHKGRISVSGHVN